MLEIIREDEKFVPFEKLEIGDLFEYDGDVYLRINDYSGMNAIRLTVFRHSHFVDEINGGERVVPLKGKLTVSR